MINFDRLENETDFEYKLRLCKAKLIDKEDIDWQEIVNRCGLDIHPDTMRRCGYAYCEFENYLKNNGVANKILSLSDFHVPYQLPVDTFSDYKNSIDSLVLNGDIMDMYSISKFIKPYRSSPMEEISKARDYIISLIEYLNPKSVFINYGNHEKRFSSYLEKNLDSDLLELMPDTPLELIINDGYRHYDKKNRCRIWYEPICNIFKDKTIIYTRDWKCKIGKSWFAHPIAYSSGTLKTCEKAMEYFHSTDKDPFDLVCIGHVHKVARSKIGYVTLFEQGACCRVDEMDYTDGKLYYPQKEGFAYICQDKDGNLIEDRSKLVTLN